MLKVLHIEQEQEQFENRFSIWGLFDVTLIKQNTAKKVDRQR
jgi:hypothetical protein